MSAKTRREIVLQEIKKSGRVNTAELAEKLNVAVLTIRRDLQELADEGIITLIHGGAVFNVGGKAVAPNVSARGREQIDAKILIGEICATLVNEGNVIFLDTGSTTLSIAHALLSRKNIAVITNSLPILNVLSTNREIQLFALAGIYYPELSGFYGGMTVKHLKTFHVDKAFIGIPAVNFELGLMTNDNRDCDLKQAALEVSRKKILVTDHTKFGNESFLKVCDINILDKIVMDIEPDEKFLRRAQKLDIEILYPARQS